MIGLTMAPLGRVRLYKDGYASFIPIGDVPVDCALNVRFYPFDQHHCQMIFESLRFTSKTQFFIAKQYEFQVGGISENDHWALELGDFWNETINYGVPGEDFSRVIFEFTVKRKPAYSAVALILPLFSISLIEFCAFFLPSDDNDRLQLSFTSLLAFHFFSSIINSELPHKSDHMPILLVIVNCYSLALVLVTIVQGVTIYFTSTGNHKYAYWLNIGAIIVFSLVVAIGTIVVAIILPIQGIKA